MKVKNRKCPICGSSRTEEIIGGIRCKKCGYLNTKKINQEKLI